MGRRVKFFLFVFLFLAPRAIVAVPVRGTEPLPFDRSLKQSIHRAFYRNGHISRQKIAAFRDGIEKRYRQIMTNITGYYIFEANLSRKKAAKKVAKKSETEAYRILLEFIDRLKTTEDPAAFNLLALRVLELNDALTLSGKKLASTMLVEKVSDYLKNRKIPVRKAPKGEAANLVDPAGGLFYSQAQLERMKRQGLDISKLNPPSDSTFRTAHDISEIDVKTHYRTGRDPLHRGLEIVFPAERGGKGYYKEIRRTQTRPKIDIFTVHNGGKVKFKLKVGSEVHSEPTAASLYAALGFSVDISQYVRDFKLVLGDITPHRFKREWNSYYSRYDVNKYIKHRGKDEEGYFIVFYEGLLEAKPKELLRVGPWGFGNLGHGGLREVRGTLVFDMWIANMDLKKAENNKLVLRKTRGGYRFFHIQHDMGFAFGSIYIERPGDFKWKLVKKKTDEYVHLSYRCFQDNPIFSYVTYADARWMIRLIAQLSREQIRAAVELGGWPESMGKLLVEKLIARRNQLVEAFDLSGEVLPNGKRIDPIPYDPHLGTADGVVERGKLEIYRLAGYIQYFGPRLRELLPIVLRHMKNAAVDGTVNGLSAVSYIKIDPGWWGWSRDIISHIMIRVNREVEPNPLPTGENDDYLVQDTMEIGFRFGYGITAGGDISYVKKYTVVYPVRTEDEGRYRNHFIVNLLLPFHVEKYKAQDNFAAVIEDYLQARGRIIVGGYGRSVPGASLEASKILLGRHFIGRKNSHRLIYFKDKGITDELAFTLFLEFIYLFHYRIPLFQTAVQKGELTRTYVEVDLDDPGAGPVQSMALERLFLDNDPSAIEKTGIKRTLSDRFFQRKTSFNLFGFVTNRSVYRVDQLKETGYVQSRGTGDNRDNPAPRDTGKAVYRYQVESRRQKGWRFLDNGEEYSSRIRFTGESGRAGTVDSPLLSILLSIEDRNTLDRELARGYLGFINAAALDDRFIDFDAAAHSRNRRWGYIRVYLRMLFYPEAIDRLLRAREMEIWNVLAEVSGHSVQTLTRAARPPDYRRRPPGYRFTPLKRLAWKTAYIIRALRKARKTPNTVKKMAYLVKAAGKAVYTKGHGFGPTLLAVLHKIAGTGNIYMNALVTMPVQKEMVFPDRVPLYNEKGFKRVEKEAFFEYIFTDPAGIYHLF